nr:nsLTP16 [Solanum melongena]
MLGKLACFVVLCMVVVAPHVEAIITCGQVQSGLAPCIPYLLGRGAIGGCCGGLKSLLGAAQTTADRRTACNCIKAAARAVKGIDPGRASGLPTTCGLNIPYDISPSVDCSKMNDFYYQLNCRMSNMLHMDGYSHT